MRTLRLTAAALLILSGLALGWNKGQLPHRSGPAAEASGKNRIAADLALYRDIVSAVRRGDDYYTVAHEKIPQYGFPIGSPLNWRLPSYAWLFSRLPNEFWIQSVLVGLSVVALAMAYIAQSRQVGVGAAAAGTFLLFGVVRWAIDGQAYLAQEPWAATLMLISLSAHSLGGRWRVLSITSGLAALFFRELALPYCGLAFLISAWRRRWREAASWGLGISLFLCFFAWHIVRVQSALAGTEVVVSAGISQWLRFSGLDFVLLTTRMNSLLFAAPAWLLWGYLLVTLGVLARQSDDSSRLACLTALVYLLSFAIIGRPENFYWGLMAAPLLAWGVAFIPVSIARATNATGPGVTGPSGDSLQIAAPGTAPLLSS